MKLQNDKRNWRRRNELNVKVTKAFQFMVVEDISKELGLPKDVVIRIKNELDETVGY